MSIWGDNQLADKVSQILSTIEYQDPTHHFGRPYISAYQLAILFAENYPEDYRSIGKLIGGEGIGERTSLAQYLARELSMRIKSGEIDNIEGAFFSNEKLKDIFFTFGDQEIRSSLTTSGYDLSIFRMIKN